MGKLLSRYSKNLILDGCRATGSILEGFEYNWENLQQLMK